MLPFKLFYDDAFIVDFGPHVFPARKYELLAELLLANGIAERSDFVTPKPAGDADVLRVHTKEYVAKVKDGRLSVAEQRTLEIPWSPALVQAVWLACGAAIDAYPAARRDGCAFVLGGGFHHAFPDHGEGFCMIHDVAVATRAILARGEAERIAIVDLDVHQGNGTAAIFRGQDDVLTVSLHQRSLYPAVKPTSSLDVELEEGMGDAEYLVVLDSALDAVERFRPDGIFFLAGADPFESDRLGGLKLTMAGLMERDRRVFERARRGGVPIVVTLAGGYALRPADTVEIHANTVRVAAAVFGSNEAPQKAWGR